MTTLETVYWAMGVTVLWLGGLIVISYITDYLITVLLNILGRSYKPIWDIFDYLRNREEFKDWKELKYFHESEISTKYDFLVEYEKYTSGLDYEKSISGIEEFLESK